MRTTRKQVIVLVFFLVYGVISAGAVWGDPLPGEILKFQQQPMIATPITDTTGVTNTYFGHDELSTAYWYPNNPVGNYRGTFMADDFADNYSTPVVHITWWGSYMNVNAANPSRQVQNFLIAFESDVAAGPGNPWSYPGNVLNAQVVSLTTNPLLPLSGNFTEKLVAGSNPAEPVFKYNAELSVPFAEQKDTVYWLKIVALDDVVGGAVPIQWGWHNRDYTVNDLLASPAVVPGEVNLNPLNPLMPVWHFQDDAVQGQLFAVIGSANSISVTQYYNTPPDGPQDYVPGVDGPSNMGQYSKDLAFELHTTPIPEPGTLALLTVGAIGLVAYAWRRWK
jgi:hypothetical protein